MAHSIRLEKFFHIRQFKDVLIFISDYPKKDF